MYLNPKSSVSPGGEIRIQTQAKGRSCEDMQRSRPSASLGERTENKPKLGWLGIVKTILGYQSTQDRALALLPILASC